MTTVLELIKDAAETARVYAPGESMGDDKAQSIFRELNRMIGSWANENFLIYSQTEENFDLSADTASYTIGSGATLDTVRPQEILEGTFLRKPNGTHDYPLTVKTLEEYRLIRYKSNKSIPWWISYNPTYPTGTLYLWWTPEVAYELHLLSLKELGSFSTLAEDISLPPGYEDAIMYNLAIRIGPKYGKKLRQDIVALASQGIKVLKRRAAKRMPPAQLEVGSFTNRGYYDINTGPFFPR